MYDAEGQCGDGDCCPGMGFASQHFAFDGFAEEEFFGDRPYDGECEQSPDVFRHGHRHLHHGVGQGDVFGHDGEAEASEYASGYGEQACLPPYGAEVACLDGADISQWAVAYQYGNDQNENFFHRLYLPLVMNVLYQKNTLCSSPCLKYSKPSRIP